MGGRSRRRNGGVAELVREAATHIRRYQPSEARAAMLAGAILIDTRCDGDRAADGVVPGSVHIPRTVLEWRADPDSEGPDPRLCGGDPLIVMCSDGYSSILAAAALERIGHAGVGDVVGGYRAWRAAGLPTEPI